MPHGRASGGDDVIRRKIIKRIRYGQFKSEEFDKIIPEERRDTFFRHGSGAALSDEVGAMRRHNIV